MSDFETTSVDVTKNSMNKIAIKQNEIHKINADKLLKPNGANYIIPSKGKPPRPPLHIDLKVKNNGDNLSKVSQIKIPKIIEHTNGKAPTLEQSNGKK